MLEIGAGCGYQAAVLSALAKEVFTIECRAELATAAADRLSRLGYLNVHVHCGDGTLGLPELGPSTLFWWRPARPGARSSARPTRRRRQDGGTGGHVENQELQLIERSRGTFRTTMLEPCRFVPLIGAHGWKESSLR